MKPPALMIPSGPLTLLARPSIVFLVSLFLRLLLWGVVGTPNPDIGDDQSHYLSIRSDLVDHGELLDPTSGRPTAYRDPGYPALLALLLWAGLESAIWIFLLQTFLAAATGAVLVWLAGRVYDSRAAAITGALFISYFSFAPYTLLVYPEVLTGFLLALLFAELQRWTVRPSLRSQVLVGTIAGAVLLSRFAIGVGLGLAVLSAIVATGRLRSRTWIVMALIPCFVVLAWCWRNERTVGAFVPNTNGAVNVYLGNNPTLLEEPAADSEAGAGVWEPLLGLSEAEWGQRSIELVREFFVQHPGEAIQVLLAKVPAILEFDRMFLGVARLGQFPERSPMFLLIVGAVIALVSAGPLVAGLAAVLSRPLAPRDWFWPTVVAFGAGVFLVQLATVGHSRYSTPAWLLLLPVSGAFLARFRWSDRRDRVALLASAAILGVVWAREVLRQ
jgi:hypothetical protein